MHLFFKLTSPEYVRSRNAVPWSFAQIGRLQCTAFRIIIFNVQTTVAVTPTAANACARNCARPRGGEAYSAKNNETRNEPLS